MKQKRGPPPRHEEPSSTVHNSCPYLTVDQISVHYIQSRKTCLVFFSSLCQSRGVNSFNSMHKSRLFSYLPVSLAVGLALTLSIVNSQLHPEEQVFSADSLQSFRNLNLQYQMTVEDLSAAGPDSSLIAGLLQADVFNPSEEASRFNKGLIVSLEDSGLLLLQPVNSLSDEDLSDLAELYESNVPEFTEVELDQMVSLESPVFNWDLETVEPEQEPVELTNEEIPELRVGVIDSGMDLSHPIFTNVLFKEGWNTITDSKEIYDDVGHGTHVGGIIASQAPGVTLIPYKIVDAQGGKLSNVLEAFTEAIEDEVHVINASFGLNSPSYALESLIQEAYDEGIVVVSAAGNSGKDVSFYPATYVQTIAVAGVDAGGHKMPNSNYGIWVDVAAYGYRVRSALPNNNWGYKSGTSQATAFVSAAVARLLMSSEELLDFEAVMTALQSSQERIDDGELAGTPIVE